MATKFRIASFNVENLFARAKVLNFKNNEQGDEKLLQIAEFEKELGKTTYDKAKIKQLYNDLKLYIDIVEIRGKLFKQNGDVGPDGKSDWDGFIVFKQEKFSDTARKNTAKVIRTLNADICALVEIDNRIVMKEFFNALLPSTSAFKKYPHHILFDGNDQRGIDVACASRFPVLSMITHIDDKSGTQNIFSRDCLEVEIEIKQGTSLWILLNHFKSKGYGSTSTSNAKRLRQATRVAEILDRFDLANDLVVVAGDLNDTPGSAPLAPLESKQNLFDALAEKFPNEADRWTYSYRGTEQQIDYLYLSKPLRDAMQDAGVERRGIYDLAGITNGAESSFNTITTYTESASDHAGIWADFSI